MNQSRIEKLEEKKKQIAAQIQNLKARENVKERKKETRKKILIGGVIIKMLKTGEMSEDRLNKFLDKHLTNEKDRSLFDLDSKKQQVESTEKTIRSLRENGDE